MSYNTKYYHDESLWQLRGKPNLKAINTYITKDGIIIGMFQGNRGQFPDIDFVVKILKQGENEKLFPPLHTFWVVDLMLKISEYKKEVKEIITYYIKFYNNLTPFQNPESRHNYKLSTVNYIVDKYNFIEHDKTLSIEYVAIIIELFCLCEKRTNRAYWFANLLNSLLGYTNDSVDYIELLKACQPGFR